MRPFFAMLVVSLSGLAAAAGAAEDLDGTLIEKAYPAGSIHEVAAADRALIDAGEARDAIQKRFEAEQHACYSRFLATSCLSDARESRRAALLRVRRVEVQANEFKRRQRAIERDKSAAAKEARASARRENKDPGEADNLKVSVDGVPQPAGEIQPQKEEAPADSRVAEHEAKLKLKEDREAADAAKRAKNVAAYQKKVREAETRRKKVDDKKRQ